MAPTPDRRATARYELPTDPADTEVVAAHLWAAGAIGVWERSGVLVAWFADASAGVPAGGSWSVEPDHDWQAAWKATIRPVRAGRFVVVPTWLADEHEAGADEVTLVLDPGRAFGSGHHATTTLCLELLADLDLGGVRVADIGCGTGILAIAAARLGADVIALDIDPDAVEVTTENAARNDVAVRAAVGSVSALDGPVEVIVANLVTDVVADLAEELVAGATGALVVGGITVERQAVALAPLRAAGLQIESMRERDGWIALLGRPDPARTRGRGPEVADGGVHPRG